MTDNYINTSLGIDRPNGNTTVTGWMHDAHLTGMTPGLLAPLPITFDGLNIKPLDGYVACVMTRTTPGQNQENGFMDEMIVSTYDGDDTTITAHPSQDKWDRIELALVCDRPQTSVANGVGGVQLFVHEMYADNSYIDPDSYICSLIGNKFYCRLGALNIPPKATSVSMDDYNSSADLANGAYRTGDHTPWWSVHERLQAKKLYWGGVEMGSTGRTVYEYVGGTDGFRPSSTGDWNPFDGRWIYVEPGWYLWECILTFKPEQTSTDGFYAFQGWFDDFGPADSTGNSRFWADMDVKSASATGLDTAQRIVNKMVYIDLPAGWHKFSLAETTLGKMAPMLSTSHAPVVNGNRCPQVCRLIRM